MRVFLEKATEEPEHLLGVHNERPVQFLDSLVQFLFINLQTRILG